MLCFTASIHIQGFWKVSGIPLTFQAAELIEKLGVAAKKSIKDKYGSNADVTQLWNTTMESVC